MAEKKRNLPPIGTQVRAKKAGWNEDLDEAQQMDLDPVEDPEEMLEGELHYETIPAQPGMGELFICRVDNQPADPDTVEKV